MWERLTRNIAKFFLKVPVDRVPTYRQDLALEYLRNEYNSMPWFQVYNLVEFLVHTLGPAPWFPRNEADLARVVNYILEEESSAYRFIEGRRPLALPGRGRDAHGRSRDRQGLAQAAAKQRAVN